MNKNDPHAMNKKLYAIDVALVGEDEAPKRWQRFDGEKWDSFIVQPIWNLSPYCYRRDPNAPPLPSWDWHVAADGTDWRAEYDYGVEFSSANPADADSLAGGTPKSIERRPSQAWFELTADMTRTEYEALQRLARGEAVDSDKRNLTPAQRAGFELGDDAIVIKDVVGFKEGQTVTLYRDDGTDIPLWKGQNNVNRRCDGAPGAYVELSLVRKPNREEPECCICDDMPCGDNNPCAACGRSAVKHDESVNNVRRTDDETAATIDRVVLGDDGVLSGSKLHRAIADARDDGETAEFFEIKRAGGEKWVAGESWTHLIYNDAQGATIRRKPKTCFLVDANGERHEWPEPIRDMPSPNAQVWVTFRQPINYQRANRNHFHLLEEGRCHATREARDAHEAALIAASKASANHG